MNNIKSLDDAVKYRRSIRIYDPEKPLDPEAVKSCIKLATLAPNSSNMQLWEFYHVVSDDTLRELTPICHNQKAASTAQQMVAVVVRKDLFRSRANFNKQALYEQFGKQPEDPLTKTEKNLINYYDKLMPFLYFDFLGILGVFKWLFTRIAGLFRMSYRQVTGCDMRIVAHKSAALAAQTFMLAMAARGIDTCPMEGLDSLRAKRALNIPMSAEINMIISCGYRKPEGLYSDKRIRVPFEEVYFKK